MTNVEFSQNKEKAMKIIDRLPHAAVKDAGGTISLLMDLTAADGVNGNMPIDFDALDKADDFNLFHDVFGIVRNMDRKTGKLRNCFIPRFAR